MGPFSPSARQPFPKQFFKKCLGGGPDAMAIWKFLSAFALEPRWRLIPAETFLRSSAMEKSLQS